MIRTRFLKQLAAIAVLIVASATVPAVAAHADGVKPTRSASMAAKASSSTPANTAVLAGGQAQFVPNDFSTQAWECPFGYPCLYDLDGGHGTSTVLDGCGWWDLNGYSNWANSARTQGNSITVYNWSGTAWVNWGTVPSYQYWDFTLKNQIDAVNVNCASTPAPF
ncbi:hypothetical protein [Micromonospora sp. CA-111912]|uniref:hypothetical protein n=1 Tax=Micromonospora sp. CA-111912 TaxID=3239955 RepID=UPI003D89DD46